MDTSNPYDTLGVAHDATQDEITRAFRTLARKYHPDVNTTPEAEARFAAVNDAFDLLRDPKKRNAFDRTGRQSRANVKFDTPSDGEGAFSLAGGDAGAVSGLFDVFYPGLSAEFEDSAGGFGADQHVRVQISLEDAYKSAAHVLRLNMPRLGSDGRIVMEPRQINIHIPGGVIPGQHLRVPGEGLVQDDAPAGDLFVEIAFAPHPVYRVDGRDLFLDLPIAPWEAALGARITLPTPGGTVDLRIPPNAHSGEKLRLKGKGLPAYPPGDIFATLMIVNPDVTTQTARAFFERMERDLAFDPRANMGG